MGRINSCLLSSCGQFTGKPLPVKGFLIQWLVAGGLIRAIAIVLSLKARRADREE